MACECLHGYAIENKDGTCGCTDVPPGTGGIKTFDPTADTRLPWNQTPPLLRPLAVNGVNGSNPMCEGLPITPGYRWIWDGQKCSQVVNYEYNPNIGQKVTIPNANFLDNLLNGATSGGGVSGFIQNNKGLLLIGAGILAFTMLSGHSMKPKSRESIVTTKF